MINKSRPLFIVSIGLILALGRYLLDYISVEEVNGEFILLIMAIINYTAFAVVVFFLSVGVSKQCHNTIRETGVSTTQKDERARILNKLLAILRFVLLTLFIAGGFFYLKCFKSAALNDVFSIIALAISIANDELTLIIQELLYNIVVDLQKKCK